ncbi:hypothetical protein ACQQ9V_09160 [Hornefia butyriciproducens]|uniref:hypothetical protein n=1 Tax=Hornefia butyriciproducens TaxID=2652293 RepID=UPI003CFF81B9
MKSKLLKQFMTGALTIALAASGMMLPAQVAAATSAQPAPTSAATAQQAASATSAQPAPSASTQPAPATASAASAKGDFPKQVDPDSITDLPGQRARSSRLADSDELLTSYMEQQMGLDDGGNNRQVTRGSKLTGQERIVYNKLKERIRKVAAGEASSTVVSIPLSDLGIQSRYSAADLGLNTIYDAEEPGKVSEAARQAVNAQFTVNLYTVLTALLGDFPYELYWYDKTEGAVFKAPKIGVFNNGKQGFVVFEDNACATFALKVARAYGSDYEVDTEKTRAAQTAAGNAKAIVAKYQGRSDIEKLKAYRDEILSLVDYNYDAVLKYEEDAIYGDPWQVIYVFDGDSSTNVVCEGYAKAFQYLCDLTDFADKTIVCNSVTGDMVSGAVSGPHMWNIVTIGRKNYLTDLTNMEGDKAPKNNELFLAGAEGTAEEGYKISWSDQYISYLYDAMTLQGYEKAELTLDDCGYFGQNKAGSGEDKPSEGGNTDPGKASEGGEGGESITPTDEEADRAGISSSVGRVSITELKSRLSGKSMELSWKKVNGAANYRIAWRKAGSGKWKTVWSGGKTRVKIGRLKKNGLYDIRIETFRRVRNESDTASGTSGETSSASPITVWVRSGWSKTAHYFVGKAKISARRKGRARIYVRIRRQQNASGYQVFCSASKSIKKARVKTLRGNRHTRQVISRPKSSGRCYVAVRPYRMHKGVRYVGVCSAVKQVK